MCILNTPLIWLLCAWQNGTSDDDSAKGVAMAGDGSIIVGGYRGNQSSFAAVKFDADGAFVWQWEVSDSFWQQTRRIWAECSKNVEISIEAVLAQTPSWDLFSCRMSPSRLGAFVLGVECVHVRRTFSIFRFDGPISLLCWINLLMDVVRPSHRLK